MGDDMKKIMRFWKMISAKNFSTLGGAISFFFIINGGSVVFLVIVFFNLMNIDMKSVVSSMNPNGQIDTIISYIYNTSYGISRSYSFFFVLTSLWSSSSLFFHMIRAGEIIYQKKRTKYGLLTRLFAVISVIIFLVLLLCCMLVILLSKIILDNIKFRVLYVVFQIAMGLIIPFVIILFFNIFVPPIKMTFKGTLKGGLFTILFWILTTIAFVIYLNLFANFKIVYGALTFIIIFMIWIYLLCQGLIIGLIINFENWRKVTVYKS